MDLVGMGIVAKLARHSMSGWSSVVTRRSQRELSFRPAHASARTMVSMYCLSMFDTVTSPVSSALDTMSIKAS